MAGAPFGDPLYSRVHIPWGVLPPKVFHLWFISVPVRPCDSNIELRIELRDTGTITINHDYNRIPKGKKAADYMKLNFSSRTI